MKLKADWKTERDRYVVKFPVPTIQSGEDQQVYEERCRQWSIHLAEQLAWKFPTEHLAVKRGDSGRPICKDCLAQGPSSTLIAWDMLAAASSGHPTLNQDPDSQNLHDPPDGPQFFEDRPEYFKAQDHIGATTTPPTTPPTNTGRQTLDAWLAEAVLIDRLYHEELGRGLNENDLQGEANWLYHWREDGATEDQIRAWIRESPEWKAKHPNG